MSICKSDRIRESILTIVRSHIELLELKEQLVMYVDYQSKKGFSFGELLLLHYDMFKGAKTDEIYTVAAAVEILILSFDILDDIEDDDSVDKPWSKEPSLALNASTALLFTCASVIRETNFHNKDQAISILLKQARRSINGQHKDLLNTCQNETDYIEMTLEKSGSLTALACLIGTVLATNAYSKEVETYAKSIGLIGQINNDLMDISTWNDKNDLVNKKYTLPIIYLLNHPDEELQFVRDYYANKIDENQLKKKRALIDRKLIETGAIMYTEVLKKVHQNKAMAEIHKLSMNPFISEQLVKYIY